MVNPACIFKSVLCIFIFTQSVSPSSISLRNPIFSAANAKTRYSSRNRHRPTRATVEIDNCFLMLGRNNIQRLDNNSTVCSYRGHNYERATKWIDMETCRTCECHAPNFIGCCEIRLVPTRLPEGCIRDPAGQHSAIPSMGMCLAPLVQVESLGRHRQREACRSPHLIHSLMGKTWVPDAEDPRDLAVAVKTRKTNVKREFAVKVEEKDMLDTLYRLMVQSSSIETIEQMVEDMLSSQK
ncbi:unnamed protein product [Clavelina lepadiformis]|uniref:Uncharacterized protein n=1 Tax=Clavelina lepadiformis TaxID=159417 RepID=A0ABP0FG26_CLALP